MQESMEGAVQTNRISSSQPFVTIMASNNSSKKAPGYTPVLDVMYPSFKIEEKVLNLLPKNKKKISPEAAELGDRYFDQEIILQLQKNG